MFTGYGKTLLCSISGYQHRWTGRIGERLKCCSLCGKTKKEVKASRPITLAQALKGN